MASRLWKFVMRRDRYWKKLGVPFVPSKPIVGSMQLFRPKPQHEVDLERSKKYGRIYGTFEGKQPVLLLSEPVLVEEVLISRFSSFSNRRGFESGNVIFDNMVGVATGEKWKRIRDIITPTFRDERNLSQITGVWQSSSVTVIKNFIKNAGKPMDGKKLFTTYALDVIALAAFGTKVLSHEDPNNIFIQKAKKIFTLQRTWRLSMWLFFPFWAGLFKVSPFSTEGMDFFKNVALEVIEKRNKSGEERNDFLKLLMKAEEQYVAKEKTAKLQGKPRTGLKRYLSRDEVIAQCVLFFVAGYDTTAATLAFATYLLALHPDIQEKARAEVDANIKAYGGEITYEAIHKMKYLQKVFDETLRLYPIGTRLERVAGRDHELADTGIIIPKDAVVAIPLYAMHRDHEIYPEPEIFNPERFSPEEIRKRHMCSYLPFGVGPRSCLGLQFAILQMKFCMSYMLSQLVIKRCSETKVPLEITSPQNILQPKEIMIIVEKRKNPSLNLYK